MKKPTIIILCIVLTVVVVASSITAVVCFKKLQDEKQNETVVSERTNEGIQWRYKNWVALGTSITSEEDGEFVEPLVKLSKLMVKNEGVSGAAMGGDILYNSQNSNSLYSADLVTIEGGINDFASSRPLGKVGDTQSYYKFLEAHHWDNGGNDVEGSFAGACYQVIKNVQKNAPYATIVCLTDTYGRELESTGAHYGKDQVNKLGLKQQDYNDMFKAVAEDMGVIVIDTCKLSGISEETPEYYKDHIHHSKAGGEKFAQTVWDQLKTIPRK